MTRIIVTGAYCVCNKGDAALRLGGLPSLKEQIPDADFTILSLFPEIDSNTYKDGKVLQAINTPLKAIDSVVRCCLWRMIPKYSGFRNHYGQKIMNVDILRDYQDSDMVIDISGDSISEVTGFYGTIYHFLHLWLAVVLEKPTIVYAQSVGPFKYTRTFAKYLLNRVDMITLRGKISYDYLKEIGIYKPQMYLTADLAFLMPAATESRMDEIFLQECIPKSGLVGISVSNLITKYYGNYEDFICLMSNVVDYIVNEFDSTILFVPHVTGPKEENDDRIVGRDVYNKCKRKEKIKLINIDYTPQEMKGIIGRCDLFIGSRMHACIGALSMCVPTINISYHHKSSEIMAMFGLENNVINGNGVTYENITDRVYSTFNNRDLIKKDLKIKLSIVIRDAQKNADIVKNSLDGLLGEIRDRVY